eukprot:ANDGO_01046.mRNA.1 Dynactin subunit 5
MEPVPYAPSPASQWMQLTPAVPSLTIPASQQLILISNSAQILDLDAVSIGRGTVLMPFVKVASDKAAISMGDICFVDENSVICPSLRIDSLLSLSSHSAVTTATTKTLTASSASSPPPFADQAAFETAMDAPTHIIPVESLQHPFGFSSSFTRSFLNPTTDHSDHFQSSVVTSDGTSSIAINNSGSSSSGGGGGKRDDRTYGLVVPPESIGKEGGGEITKKTANLQFHKLAIGNHVWIGRHSSVHALRIGSYVRIGSHVRIGPGCILNDCCVIEDGSVVAPCTVVPPYSRFAGNPARMVTVVGESAVRAAIDQTNRDADRIRAAIVKV